MLLIEPSKLSCCSATSVIDRIRAVYCMQLENGRGNHMSIPTWKIRLNGRFCSFRCSSSCILVSTSQQFSESCKGSSKRMQGGKVAVVSCIPMPHTFPAESLKYEMSLARQNFLACIAVAIVEVVESTPLQFFNLAATTSL